MTSSSSSSYHIVEASKADIQAILEVTNDAFMADAFFKFPQYHLRFDLDTVQEMIHSANSVFLVAKDSCTQEEVVGSMFLHWEIDGDKVIGKFSAVSVPAKNGKRGIGKALVQAAEHKVKTIARSQGLSSAALEMGVINLRTDLFPWYEGQGFVKLHEIRPNDPEVERITLDEMKDQVCCVLMRKELSLP